MPESKYITKLQLFRWYDTGMKQVYRVLGHSREPENKSMYIQSIDLEKETMPWMHNEVKTVTSINDAEEIAYPNT